MAIKTHTDECQICGRPAGDGPDVVLFPPFVADAGDPLYRFNDGVFHRGCLESDPDGVRALSIIDAVLAAGRPDARVCAVCGEMIGDPDDYFGTGLLTTDPRSPLHAFNFMHLHRSHWTRWSRREEFRQALEEATRAGWLGPEFVLEDGRPRWTGKKSRRR